MRVAVLVLAAAAAITLAPSAGTAGEKPLKVTVHPAPYGSKPAVFRVALPKDGATKLKGAGAALLRFDGVEIDSNKNLILRVFVGAPDASLATSMDDKRYLGNISIVAAGATAKGKKKSAVSAQLELTPEAKAAVAAAGELAVTLIPIDVEGKEPADVEYTVKKIALEM